MRETGYLREVELLREKVPSFEHYPFSIPVVRSLERLEIHPAVTFLVGENGSGKSTLLEAIAVKWGFNAEGGTKNFRFATKEHFKTTREFLNRHESMLRILLAHD